MLSDFLRSVLPSEQLQNLRSMRKKIRNLRWRTKIIFNHRKISKREIVDNLRSLGVTEGQDLMVHSSLSRIGFVVGGADTVVDSLIETIGKAGTLLLPAYPMKGSMLETMKDPTPFDIRLTPSTVGKISEVLRDRPGTMRSAHPTHSVVAIGPKSALYLNRHHIGKSAFGPQSPFWQLVEQKGMILCLGTGIDKTGVHHVIEDKVDAFPLKVYLPDIYKKSVRLFDGSLIEVEVLVHDPALAPIRVDSDKKLELELLENMRGRGIIREGRIGNAEAYLFAAADLIELHETSLSKGKMTIYALR